MKKADNRSGFTMVEIIAVLVIIGIMAAVAAPKFINMASEARDKAAMAGIQEAQGTLSVAFAKAYLQNNGGTVVPSDVLTAAELTAGDEPFGDVIINLSQDGTNITLRTVSVDGTAVTTATNVVWSLPTQL